MIDRRSEIGPDGGSTLRHYLRALWRRKWVGLAPLVLIPLVTFVASHRQQSLYEASADVFVNQQQVAATSLIGQTPAFDDAGRAMDTEARLARVHVVAARALAAAGVPKRPPQALLDRSAVYPLANILRFTVDDPSPVLAARLASEYARQFVRYRHTLDTAGLARTLAELRGQIASLEADHRTASPLYLRLTDREQQLESLQVLRTSNVSVVQAPETRDAAQIAPRPLRNTALGLVAGLVLGLILVFFWETLSTRPRSEDEIEALLDMPCLGRVRVRSRAGSVGSLPLLDDPGAPEADAFHALRTNLELANGTADARTIMVTSLHAGEGTTATAGNLAVALARAGRHVVVVDLDLRTASLTEAFGSSGRPGVTSLARGAGSLADALVSVPLEGVDEWRRPDAAGNGSGGAGARLEVLGSGPLPPHPAEVLSSSALAAALAELERRADIVVLVVPPLLDAPDAAAVSTYANELLLVVNSRLARKPELADARRTLEAWPVAKLGFVLTEAADTSRHTRQSQRAAAPARARVAEQERVA